MKIRTDYVTNSSSSSFVIARHKTYTDDKLRANIERHKDDIEDILERHGDRESYEELVEKIIDRIPGEAIDLGEWVISGCAVVNDYDNADLFLYDYLADLDEDLFKVGRAN